MRQCRMPSTRKVTGRKAAGAPVLDRPVSAKRTTRATSPRSASTPKSATYAWRRLHDGSIIAQASPVPGMGSWRVSAYRTTEDADVVHDPRAFSLLREAHQAADALVQEHFAHKCRTGVCGRWLRWPEK